MTYGRRIAATLVLAGAGLVLLAPGADAHALLQSSDPAADSQVGTAPDAVVLVFTEDPEVGLSTVRVLDTSGASFEAGGLVRVAGRARTISVPVRELPTGVYTVAWRVLSRADGHVTGGAFSFGVGVSPIGSTPPPSASVGSPPVSPVEIAGRWLLYVGLIGLVGGAWIASFVFPAPPAGSRRLLTASLTTALAGLTILGLTQRSAAGVALGDLLSTPIGHALIWRATGIAGAALMLFVAARLRGENARTAIALAGIAAAGALYAHVDAGHAAASEPVWRNVATQFVHVLAVAVWIGGLAALLVGIRGEVAAAKARAVARFSFGAGLALAFVAATGVVRALDEVGSWSALTASTYGRLVVAKVVLLVGLAVLGAVNRYRNVARIERDLAPLRRISRVELVLAASALASAAGLASSSPPANADGLALPPEERIVVVGSDFGQTVKVRLAVAPGFAGSNVFRAIVADPSTGEEIEATRVALRFRFVDATVGESELELVRSGRGVYRAEGRNLSLDGPWTVTVLVQRASDSVEIELALETRCRTQAVPVGGGPTLYNVTTASGSAQLYVDPGIAGQNEVHVTFFTSGGGELPVTALPTITGTREGAATSFEVRRFGAGHFVADAQLEAGRWRFAFAGVADDGRALRGCFEDTVR